MSRTSGVVHHPLVRVRGGATMLLTALVGSLPPLAQVALRRLLLVIPVLVLAKVQRTAVQALVRRVLLPLLTGAIPAAAGAAKPVQLRSSSTALLGTLSHAIVVYSLGEKLMKADERASSTFTAAAVASLSSDDELLRRLVGAVADETAAWLPSTLRGAVSSASPAAPRRRCAAFFATTTPVALSAYLHHIHGRSRASHITIYAPGILIAPWTTHLAPLLRDIAHRHGTAIVGYDVCADAERYEVDLKHIRRLLRQHPQPGAGDSRAGPSPGVLIIASMRGRRVGNVEAACVLAKVHGWEVVELCVPTLPLEAVHAVGPQPRPTWLRERPSPSTTAPVRPDLRLTSFDDAGMYGGAVVEVCSSDDALITRMRAECQPGRADAAAAGPVSAKSRVSPTSVAALRTARPALLAATVDAVASTNDLVAKVWVPWARRLCAAAWREADVLRQASVTTQEALAALRRFPVETLPQLPGYAHAELRRLRSICTGAAGRGVATTADVDDAQRISADTPVEQRTTYITSPMAPLATTVVPLPALSPQSHAAAAAGGDSGGGGTVTPARDAVAVATAPLVFEAALTNSAVEWRIRLRWSVLLLSPALAAAGQPHHLRKEPAASSSADVAYLSLWSFAVQLPPWVVVVSAADDGETARGERRSSCCVEACAAALLVRITHPASARAAAELLREEAQVEASAVRLRAWGALASSPAASAVDEYAFEDAVVFPSCPQAAALGEELLYLPLSPDLPVAARAAMLRVLWEKVPHSNTASRTCAPSTHVQTVLDSIYRAHLPRLQHQHGTAASATSRSGTDAVSEQEAQGVQRVLFDGGASSAAAASLSTRAAVKAFTQTVVPALVAHL
ncbi:hypothetical protein NESM_000635600 [Novymonas esmeraldas]|uniref:Uncharacterized protein n=1 Tax=Novymonas esmeraldas TaxID=1808958 RepID=A0AAW0ERX3_9TRYP